jgi:hypothetical protein
LARQARSRGYKVFSSEVKSEIKTAGLGAQLKILACIDMRGYIGNMSVSLDASFNQISI